MTPAFYDAIESILQDEIAANERFVLDLVAAGRLDPELAKACQEGFGRCAMKVAARLLPNNAAPVRVTEVALLSMGRVAECRSPQASAARVAG